MRQLLFAGLVAASLFTLGCATTGAAAAPEAPYAPTGEVNFSASGSARSASFNDTRVVGSRINMSRRSDGKSWAGTIADQTVDVDVYPDHVSGVGFTLARQDTAEGIILTGQLQGNTVRFELLNDKMLVRTQDFSYTLPKTGPGQYGPGGVVKLTGTAASENPPWPQIGLALMGTF